MRRRAGRPPSSSFLSFLRNGEENRGGEGGILTQANSIDARTDDLVQRAIRKKFPCHTIIAVAHRLDTILDFDKVAVLEAGRLVEFDSPYALLEMPGSAFSRLYHATATREAEDGNDDLEVVV
jgi:ABC-type multidrug transport system ATPase subunit